MPVAIFFISLQDNKFVKNMKQPLAASIFVQTNKMALFAFFHLVGWGLFIYLTAPMTNRAERPPEDIIHWIFIVSYLFLILYFYCNSNFLVPHYLSKKRLWAFIGITVLAYILFCFVIPSIFQQYFLPEMHFKPGMPPRHPDFHSPENRRMNPFGIIRHFELYSRSSQFLIVFIISTGLKVISQWFSEKQRLQELEKSMVQAELSFLKSQIHPHFLFNSLNSIYVLALSKDDKAPEAILSLSEFLRFVTTESNRHSILLDKEVKMVEEYIHLQNLRVSEKFELRFNKEGDFTDWMIMPLTFLPFIENAFKYGISSHLNCYIHIDIKVDNGIMDFTCDNSVISEKNEFNFSAGVGLDNIRKRLELVYPGRYSLAIETKDVVFHVALQINLKEI